ncbi:MAG: acyl-CoA carboxylase subunit beta [Bryobacterales bacterium]|nr:acyl-CoA carboxylase subunit beta [Bryobacterales bacterium]
MAFPLGPQSGLTGPDAEERGARRAYMHALIAELQELEDAIRLGGGPKRIERQRKAGKLLARERIAALLDEGEELLELGLLMAHDAHGGVAPAAGVVTGIGRVGGRQVAVMANDATVKAGSWFPETVSKVLRIQEAAMRCRIPIVYLVDSAGVFLPEQHGTFPGKYGGARIFHNCARMRRQLRIPQISAVMGQCIAGGAYLPALSDVILMVEGTSFMGLGGPNLVQGAIGQQVEAEALGGASMHTEQSGVAHYRVADDEECIARIRTLLLGLPRPPSAPLNRSEPVSSGGLDEILPSDRRLPYDMHAVVRRIVDRDGCLEFMAGCAPELLCANVQVGGWPVGLIANRRGLFRDGDSTRIGAIIYAETARKAAEFVQKCDRQGHPLVYFQDVTGFMVGPQAERSGIIRAGAEMVESMATTRVPKIVVTLRHASGAGYYAMAGQGFDPEFIFGWPTARVGVMEGESAVQAMFASELRALEDDESGPPEELLREIEQTRQQYERTLDAKWCASKGHVDAIIRPEATRDVLISCLEAVHGHGYVLGTKG